MIISQQNARKILPYIPGKLLPLTTQQPGSVLVGGCFDLLHYGHLNFLQSAKALGQTLIVALEPDTSIMRNKGAAPIHTQQQRAEILAELICTDHILLLPELRSFEDYLELVKAVKPAFLAITSGDTQLLNKQRQAEAIQAQLIEVNNLIEGLSSSLIKANHL